MKLTPKAEMLRGPIRDVLVQVRHLLDPPAPRLSELVQVVRISAADAPTALLARPLIEKLGRTAPNISIVFKPWLGLDIVARELTNGETELGLALFDRRGDHIKTETLFEADYVVAMRREHPAAESFDLKSWLAWPHIVVSGRGERHTPLDVSLRAIGLSRQVGLVVPSFQLVPEILATTDLFAMLPRKSFEARSGSDLVGLPPPLEVASFPLHLAWHDRNTDDPGIGHVAGIVRAVLAEETSETITYA
ncbi:putative LysR-type regulator [Salipiger mucosus DSM 16094]|uniref:Putative LysR-type regulator n=2 Tax=Salipiger mucosus TaxID=263378 RepID=S9QRU3_9RHOB|nr:putative LysR-type regulator [Salipiger mucosus DSM 16094]